MDFARKQLEKYGWTAGKGLGKNENGIAEALKPKLKRSVTGVGYDPASDFTEHWWNDLYNKAAKNLEVEEVNSTISIIKKDDSADFEITNNMWHLKKIETSDQNYAKKFVKKSILCNGGSKLEHIKKFDTEAEESKKVFIITDEELYKACEGRTAHKGARHGLKALGKLARIEQQEQILLNEAKYDGYSHNQKIKENDKLTDNINIKSTKTKKHKQKHSHKDKNKEAEEKFKGNTKEDTVTDFAVLRNDCDQIDEVKPKKKKKIKDNVNGNEESVIKVPTVPDLEINSSTKKRKKKKKESV